MCADSVTGGGRGVNKDRYGDDTRLLWFEIRMMVIAG